MENDKHSALGVASFFMGVVCGLLATFFLFMQSLATYVSPAVFSSHSVLSILFFILLFGNLLALIFGIMSFFQKNRRKLFGLMGTVFSAGMLFLNIGLFIIIDVNF